MGEGNFNIISNTKLQKWDFLKKNKNVMHISMTKSTPLLNFFYIMILLIDSKGRTIQFGYSKIRKYSVYHVYFQQTKRNSLLVSLPQIKKTKEIRKP